MNNLRNQGSPKPEKQSDKRPTERPPVCDPNTPWVIVPPEVSDNPVWRWDGPTF